MFGWSLLFCTRSCLKRISVVTVRSGVTFIAVLFVLAAPAVFAETALEGRLDVIWGDPHRQPDTPAVRILTLTEDDGEVTELYLSEELLRAAGGFYAWNGKRVRVTLRAPGSELPVPDLRPGTRQAAALTLLGTGGGSVESLEQASVSGSHPWVSILCKFNDVAAEPKNLAYFQGMYANVPSGLDHYWREVSYDNIDIVGSTAVDWVEMPGSRSSYIPSSGNMSYQQLGALFDDCTAAADPFVDFSNGGMGGFSGINMMFNANLDCCAWGGQQSAFLDGVFKTWRVTWNPPWGYANSGVIAHEMGHGFGLPHANNWDDDGYPYDSPWDVMSRASGSYAVLDPVYGRLGQHTNMHHKYQLQWVAGARLLEVADGENVTATIDAAAFPGSPNYYMARLPIPGSNRYYTVEVRKRIGNYDGAVPGDAVIIHEVAGRIEPSWSYDADLPPADFADNEGTMWRVGETFTDAAENIRIMIDSETANGFVVTINRGLEAPLNFGHGFE